MKPPPPVLHHLFVDDGLSDGSLAPKGRCGVCGLPRTNRHHELPPTPREVLDEQARRLGERDDQERF